MTVDTLIGASTDLFGKTVDELQENVAIGSNAITGHLFYQDDYTGFSSKPEEQTGNYLAIHCNIPGHSTSEYSISVKVTNPVTLDSDGIVVLRIADKTSQTVTVVASADGLDSYTKVFTLSGLTVDSE